MSGALFIQNEKDDTVRRTPPISSNQFPFPAYSQLNTNYHVLPNYYTSYGIIIELHIELHIAISTRRASYSASTCHPHAMGSNLHAISPSRH